jgi:hypothetical protein
MIEPVIILLPYNNEPATGSRIPSISTGGAAMKPMMKQVVAVNNVGNIKQPNQPMYKRFSVLVIQAEKRSQTETLSRLSKVAVIKKFYYFQA